MKTLKVEAVSSETSSTSSTIHADGTGDAYFLAKVEVDTNDLARLKGVKLGLGHVG